MHIFENEWVSKSRIVKSRIQSMLGSFEHTTYARQCHVEHVDDTAARSFLDENHLQGHVNAKVKLGLYSGDELVSLMTFGKPRFSSKYEWEMLRFCNKLGYHVPGGASRLLKHFEDYAHPKSLVSYADRRWSRGQLYNALGFKFMHASSPNYWYWKQSTSEFLPRLAC